MRELIAKLEAATGPDRELDEAIHAATNKPLRTGLRWGNIPAYTASIDAAVALAERVLPGWGYYLRSDKEGNGCGMVYPDAFRVTPCHCMGATPAIAICLAILNASILRASQEGSEPS